MAAPEFILVIDSWGDPLVIDVREIRVVLKPTPRMVQDLGGQRSAHALVLLRPVNPESKAGEYYVVNTVEEIARAIGAVGA